MGWKSTIDITRSEAINAIIMSEDKSRFEEFSNEELKDRMYDLGIGDDENLPYYGYNFWIDDEK